MKRLSVSLSLVLVFAAVLTLAAPAAAVTIGTLTAGTGTADLGTGTFAFSGHFAFDNNTLYGGMTLKQIFGDGGQYSFAADTAGTLHAYDVNGYNSPLPGAIHDKSTVKWGVYGTYNGTTLYGQTMTMAFNPSPSNQASGTFTSDGYIHWYYGYDETISPTNGKTSNASLGLPDISYFLGTYAITGGDGNHITYNISGDFQAAPTPTPGSVLLLGSGLLGLLILGRRRLLKRS